MKLRIYWTYATRSLARNGQRTLLAIFCVAVGVLAIVSLELVGGMIGGAINGNVRDTNGGDVQVRSDVIPFSQRDLQKFDALQSQGVLTAWTAASVQDAQTYDKQGNVQFYSVGAINPATFHLVDPPIFLNPSGDTLSQALAGGGAVATQQLLQQLNAHVGDTLNIASGD